jgi:hypothetical protein
MRARGQSFLQRSKSKFGWRNTFFAESKALRRRHERSSLEDLIEAQPAQIAFRIKTWRLLYLCAVGTVLLQMNAYALDPNRRISQYGHTAWKTQDGFQPDPSLGRTADGYMLMSGPQGFFRFDGNQFVPYVIPKGTRPGRSINSPE